MGIILYWERMASVYLICSHDTADFLQKGAFPVAGLPGTLGSNLSLNVLGQTLICRTTNTLSSLCEHWGF